MSSGIVQILKNFPLIFIISADRNQTHTGVRFFASLRMTGGISVVAKQLEYHALSAGCQGWRENISNYGRDLARALW
jgi:hypothetical protein